MSTTGTSHLHLWVLLGGAAAGFALSRFLGPLGAFFGDLTGAFGALNQLSNQNSFAFGLLFTLLGAAVPFFVAQLGRAFRAVTHPDAFQWIFPEAREIHIAIPPMGIREFRRIGTTSFIPLPSNTPFVPVGIAMGMASLQAAIDARRGRGAVIGFDSRLLHDVHFASHACIALGGPYVNGIVKEVLDRGLIPHFQLTDEPAFVDEGTTFTPERESADSDAALRSDYGVVICMASPWNAERRLLILFGLWPPATRAAVEAFLDPACMRKARLRSAIRRGKNVIMILKVTVTGLFEGRAELVKVREW